MNVKKRKKNRVLATTVLINFFEQIHMFLQSGITIWESLSIMEENAKDPNEKRLYYEMYDYVLDGKSLSGAMNESGSFPEYAVNMCKIGEQTGRLDETVVALQVYYAEKDALAQSMKSAIAYPLCMAGMVLMVVFVLIVQVMPVFQQVFAQLGLELNPFASNLLSTGQVLNQYAFVILLVFCSSLLTLFLMQKTKYGKRIFSNLFDYFPLTKKLANARSANSFAFATSLMLSSGMETLTAFEFAQTLAHSSVAKKKISKMEELLVQGLSLSDAIIKSEIFASSYNGMIVAGTRVGSSDEMLMSIAKRYHVETERRTEKLLGIIEPSLVAVLCIMVGVVMLSVMLPLMGILAGMQI